MTFATAISADATLRGRFGGPDIIIADPNTLEIASVLPTGLFIGLTLLLISAACSVGWELRAERND